MSDPQSQDAIIADGTVDANAVRPTDDGGMIVVSDVPAE